MAETTVLRIMGAPGSPYTRKLLSSLRYRHIPYRMLWGSHGTLQSDLPEPKVKLLPTAYFETPDGTIEPMVDTTPILRRLEATYPGRSLLPDDPEIAFYNDLIEDYADEWLTKAMFHYRWFHEADRENAGPLLVFWNDPTAPADRAETFSQMMIDRQYNRLYVVGSNDVTATTIERSYFRFLHILDDLVAKGGYVFGERPASADFAIFGQMTQLGQVDPTPTRILSETSRRVRAWLDRMEDLSGLPSEEISWPDAETVRSRLRPLLNEIGQTYAPFLIANAKAIGAGQPTVDTEIDGAAWVQPVFPYQAKCLSALITHIAGLDDNTRTCVERTLTASGCEVLIGHTTNKSGHN